MRSLVWLALSSAAYAGLLPGLPALGPRVCTVRARGHQEDDVPNILKAFHDCNAGGTVVFPEDESYWIATRLNPVINDVVIQWRGKWTVRIHMVVA